LLPGRAEERLRRRGVGECVGLRRWNLSVSAEVLKVDGPGQPVRKVS
jgi:hypothetical protein